MKLTIAIPTFERESALRNLLQQLSTVRFSLPTEVVVIDNSSQSYDAEAAVNEYRHAIEGLRFRRNSSNFGMSANFLECYRLAEGDWVWVIGDDDEIEVAAVPLVEQALRSADLDANTVAINFSTNFIRHNEPGRLDCLEDLPADRELFRNLLFLSSNIVRREGALSKLSLGYQLASSMAPHLGIILAQLTHGHILLSPIVAARAAGGETSWRVQDFLVARSCLLRIAQHLPRQDQEAFRNFLYVDRQPFVFYLRKCPEALMPAPLWHSDMACFMLYANAVCRPRGWREAVLCIFHIGCCVLGLPHYRVYRKFFGETK